MAQVIATDETSGDGIQQIIYVSYQDPDDPNQSRTLHFGKNDNFIICIYTFTSVSNSTNPYFTLKSVDAGMMRNKEEKTNVNQSLSHLSVSNDSMLSNPGHANENNNSNERINVELSESDLQLQVKMNKILNCYYIVITKE